MPDVPHKSLLRCVGVLLALLTLSSTARSQQIPRCGNSIPTHSGCLIVNYDRFKDSTIVSLQFMVVDKGNDKRIVFSLMSSYDGDSPAGKDRKFAVALISVGVSVEPSQTGRVLYVLIDGNSRSTFTFLTTKADTNFSTRISSEQLLSIMTADELTKFARAKSLEMKLGEDEFAFDEAMRGNFVRFWGDYIVLPRA